MNHNNCVCDLTSSFAFGLIPFYYFSLSNDRVQLISTFGTGILVGTALIVIIPEGVRALFDTQRDPNLKRKIIGGSLIAGFMMMYLIDAIPDYIVSRESQRTSDIDMSNLRFTRVNAGEEEEGLGGDVERLNVPGANNSTANNGGKQISKSTKFSIGLIIHSIADGVALGAAIVSGGTELETLVFLAILIHKAPASFGLTSVLLRHGLDFKSIRTSLGLFAAAAPAGALLTYAITTLLWKIGVSMDVITIGAVLLVFSGGTFLYVSVHAMQDLESHDNSKDKGLVIALLAIGMSVPLLTYLLPE